MSTHSLTTQITGEAPDILTFEIDQFEEDSDSLMKRQGVTEDLYVRTESSIGSLNL